MISVVRSTCTYILWFSCVHKGSININQSINMSTFYEHVTTNARGTLQTERLTGAREL